MNLFERAQALSRDIHALNGLRERASQAGKFEKRANDLRGPTSALQKLSASIEIMIHYNIPVSSLDRGLVGTLRDRVADLRARYNLDKNVMLDPFPEGDVRYILNQPLSQLPTKAKAALLEGWQCWVKTQLPKLDDEVVAILAGIPALHDSVMALRTFKSSADKISIELPVEDDVLNHLKELRERITDAWHKLAGDGIPTEVLAFLRAAGSRDGVGFGSLTSEVLNWLTAHGLRDSLRVRMG